MLYCYRSHIFAQIYAHLISEVSRKEAVSAVARDVDGAVTRGGRPL